MKNMLYKEFNLAMHPTSIMFLLLSAMLLIPNYLYYVTFFYTALAIFFTCLSGRENNDIFYSMTLPVRKRDIVKSRFLYVVILELVQILTAVPFALIRRTYTLPGNIAGIDANVAFFGFSFMMLGIFNLVFFTRYYRNTDKVGTAFAVGSTAIAVFMLAAESGVHIVPFMKNVLDTRDPDFILYKVAVLIGGIILYVLMTFFSYMKSAKSFEKLDL
ncbi:ABC-2 transporter permease [Clostridium luticellarii]|uniref:ABC-2 transporter permease n=1 Tax=Clostridium luticellarii TaxID=1691940 RepID=UPI002352D23A|nr:ABC-2 transporter permease [Clostridium luticellarii]MCI1946320.1 ABC-2 transporter permease [Clostridium luticellarii]MCI1969545.1 ABC-2 transporter permease [Clostridium luticellarii]